MIINEQKDAYKVVTQHDHASISFEIANHWREHYFPFPEKKQETLYAIRHHDRAWIPLDRHLLWNEEAGSPYDFTDYPLTQKLFAYGKGIQEVEQETKYGAILCSEHYSSFFGKDDREEEIQVFLRQEKERRERLCQHLDLPNRSAQEDKHLRLLQFSDNLSLYLCMQEPGISKENEVSWFRNGFPQTFKFAPDGIMARWLDRERVELEPFPFENPLSMSIPTHTVLKKEIEKKGVDTAWKDRSKHFQEVTFVPSHSP